jgi:hypothetical protein
MTSRKLKALIMTLCLLVACGAYAGQRVQGPGVFPSYINVGNGKFTVSSEGKTVIDADLNDATGNEAALSVLYEVNKATSGTDYGILLNMTDTSSPGTSYLMNLMYEDSSKFYVTTSGHALFAGNISTATGVVLSQANQTTLSLQAGTFTTAVARDMTEATSTNTQTAEQVDAFAIKPIYNQASGTASNTDLKIDRTETAVGSGTQNLVDFMVDSVSKFRITTAGIINSVVASAPASVPTNEIAMWVADIFGAGSATLHIMTENGDKVVPGYQPFAQAHIGEDDADLVLPIGGAGVYYAVNNTPHSIMMDPAGRLSFNNSTGAITVETGGAGIYRVMVSLSISGGINDVAHGDVFNNGTEIDSIAFEEKFSGSSALTDASASGFVNASVGDSFTFKIKNETDDSDITVEHYNFSMGRISLNQ